MDPARGGVCVLCVCETSMWALPFWRPQAISLLDLGPVGWPSWLQKGAETAHKVKIPPTRTRNQMVRVPSCCCFCWRCRSSCWRGVAPEMTLLLLLKEALQCYRSRCFFCCSRNETARGKGGQWGTRSSGRDISDSQEKRGTLQQYWPNRCRKLSDL